MYHLKYLIALLLFISLTHSGNIVIGNCNKVTGNHNIIEHGDGNNIEGDRNILRESFRDQIIGNLNNLFKTNGIQVYGDGYTYTNGAASAPNSGNNLQSESNCNNWY